MDIGNKSLSIVLVSLLAVSSLLLIRPANAQSITRPSIPEFTIKLADHSYDVPGTNTTTVDPYTGKQTVVTHAGYHVKNLTIDVTIKNQPLILTLPARYNETLYYNVRVKGHFGGNWTELYSPTPILGPYISSGTLPPQSNSQYTVLSLPASYQAGDNVDFQVEAFYGDYITVEPASHDPFIPSHTEFGIIADGESGWSPTQTFTMPETSATVSPSPTVPEFFSTTIVVIALFEVTLFLAAFKKIKNKK